MIVVAPNRGKTFDLFLEDALNRGFDLLETKEPLTPSSIEEKLKEYSNEENFDKDVHQPRIVILEKPSLKSKL